MPIFAIFGHFLAIFGRFGPFLDREHQKQCNCNLLGATGPTNYINMVSNGYLEIWSVSDPKTNSGAKQDPKLTWGGQNWSFCTLCSPTNLFYTKNVNSEMVTSKSYFLAWNRPVGCSIVQSLRETGRGDWAKMSPHSKCIAFNDNLFKLHHYPKITLHNIKMIQMQYIFISRLS